MARAWIMNSNKKLRIKAKGFTLIELLVVISIIALLLSILMPSLCKVKDQAKLLVCVHNSKQVGLLLSIYQSEYNNSYPPYYTYDRVFAERQYWPALLADFDEKWSKGETPPDYFFCPNQKDKEVGAGAVSYGYNYYDLGNWDNAASRNPTPRFAKITQVRNPASKIVFCESRYNVFGYSEVFDDLGMAFCYPPGPDTKGFTRLKSSYSIANRHSGNASEKIDNETGRVAVLWGDSHATSVIRKDVLDNEKWWEVKK